LLLLLTVFFIGCGDNIQFVEDKKTSYELGETLTLKWKSSDKVKNEIICAELVQNELKILELKNFFSNQDMLEFTIPHVLDTGIYQIKISSAENQWSSLSPPFHFTMPQIKILQGIPDTVQKEHPYTIKWEKSPGIMNKKLDIYFITPEQELIFVKNIENDTVAFNIPYTLKNDDYEFSIRLADDEVRKYDISIPFYAYSPIPIDMGEVFDDLILLTANTKLLNKGLNHSYHFHSMENVRFKSLKKDDNIYYFYIYPRNEEFSFTPFIAGVLSYENNFYFYSPYYKREYCFINYKYQAFPNERFYDENYDEFGDRIFLTVFLRPLQSFEIQEGEAIYD